MPILLKPHPYNCLIKTNSKKLDGSRLFTTRNSANLVLIYSNFCCEWDLHYVRRDTEQSAIKRNNPAEIRPVGQSGDIYGTLGNGKYFINPRIAEHARGLL